MVAHPLARIFDPKIVTKNKLDNSIIAINIQSIYTLFFEKIVRKIKSHNSIIATNIDLSDIFDGGFGLIERQVRKS